MGPLGWILVAYEEGLFLGSTADLLREEGYQCDCIEDGPAAAERLREGGYDVLIADIRMPGNPNLELIQEISGMPDGVQAILVTGYPSMESAIKSVQLPVSAYLVKPNDLEELGSSVRTAMERSKIYGAVRDTERHLKEWHDKLRAMLHMVRHEPGAPDPVPVEAFVSAALSCRQAACKSKARLSCLKRTTSIVPFVFRVGGADIEPGETSDRNRAGFRQHGHGRGEVE